ncbi:MAG: restriction endonuclease [Caldilineaceae bacterium]|nr:restriction endonuclease [Caldilineaceae bacterium]
MATVSRRIIELQEYGSVQLPDGALSDEAAVMLHRHYAAQISLAPPSFLTNRCWQLTAQGYVGFIPVTPDLGISLKPKVPIANLFRMLEVAYSLREFRVFEGLVGVASLTDFYEHLAIILSRRVLDRCRRGIYREYVPYAETLPYMRGQLNLQPMLRAPWRVEIPCRYEEHTADIEENRILAWTLHRILRSGLCQETRALPSVRRAYRAMQQTVKLEPYGARSCVNRLYNRLNSDYHPMHALCYFFLDQSGPSHELGQDNMLPFLVDMPRLYERYVAEWLKRKLGDQFAVKAQERYAIDPGANLHFDIDLVVEERASGQVRWVMDTKYKAPSGGPASDDVQQVVAYAEAKGAREAILIYPKPLANPLNQRIGDVRVRTLTFSVEDELHEASQRFIQGLVQAKAAVSGEV